MFLCVLFFTWFPFTEAVVLSIEAESVGVKRAEASLVLILKPRNAAQKPAPTTKIFFHKNNFKECDFWLIIFIILT